MYHVSKLSKIKYFEQKSCLLNPPAMFHNYKEVKANNTT